jgi:hypothetical protein
MAHEHRANAATNSRIPSVTTNMPDRQILIAGAFLVREHTSTHTYTLKRRPNVYCEPSPNPLCSRKKPPADGSLGTIRRTLHAMIVVTSKRRIRTALHVTLLVPLHVSVRGLMLRSDWCQCGEALLRQIRWCPDYSVFIMKEYIYTYYFTYPLRCRVPQVEYHWSRPTLGSTQDPVHCVPGASSPKVKPPGREADHSPPTNPEVKGTWVYTATPPYIFMTWCLIN